MQASLANFYLIESSPQWTPTHCLASEAGLETHKLLHKHFLTLDQVRSATLVAWSCPSLKHHLAEPG